MALKFGQTSTDNPTSGKPGDVKRNKQIPANTTQHCLISWVKLNEEDGKLALRFAVVAPGEEHHGAGMWGGCNLETDFGLRYAATIVKATGLGDPDSGDWELDADALVGRTLDVEVEADNRADAKHPGEIRPSFCNFTEWTPEGDWAVAVQQFIAALSGDGDGGDAGNNGNGSDSSRSVAAGAGAGAAVIPDL